MGMNVYGKNPENETGKYFRNNVWWWRPLWDYCREVSPVAHKVRYYGSNDGDGLNAEDSKQLAADLRNCLETQHTRRYALTYTDKLSGTPDETCDLCDGTGTRTDIKVENGCNKCKGTGKVRPWVTWYPFSEDNVREFAAFLEACGGFAIN